MNKQQKKKEKAGEGESALPVAADFIYDATEALLGSTFKEGLNPTMRSASGLELIIKTTPGEAIEYLILNRNGEPVDEVIRISVTNTKSKETTCWECGIDSNGDTHCWKVPCPDIVGPWKPGKVLDVGLRFM
jgi:hypothetical protein